MKPGRKRSIVIDPATGCHVAQAGVNHQGYPVYKHKGRRHSAARVVWMEQRGPIPDGLQIDHLCRNRACVNLDHLELVTCEENVRRSRVAKLDLATARMIRESSERGIDLARRYGVSQALVSLIRSGKVWRESELLKTQRERGA